MPAILSFPYFKGYEITNTGERLTLPRSHFPYGAPSVSGVSLLIECDGHGELTLVVLQKFSDKGQERKMAFGMFEIPH